MPIQGIDLSSWQGAVDFGQVYAAGYGFAIIKATQGVTYPNPYFPVQWPAALGAGLVRLAYHYAVPDANPPEAELGYFLSVLAANGGLSPGDGVMLDLERPAAGLLDWTLRWLRGFEAAQGFKPIVYSRTSFLAPEGLEDPQLADYGLMLAAYQATEPSPPPPWPFIAIWQSGQGRVPGIQIEPVDQDVFYGTADQLRLYGKQPSALQPWDEHAKFQTAGYIFGGSGPRDLRAWLLGFAEPAGGRILRGRGG